ncbi:MAG: hypothetical protein VYC34_04695, partial [Planctomycetota bacterium]|nr:hypothetical protein [Planctomycetota bacterium]
CLRPGVQGMSENIRVISVIGRFLEHSRIFHFANGQEDPVDGEWFIGSADWMYRNLNARVEAITPVIDPTLRRRLKSIVDTSFADHRNAWDMNADGTYTQRMPPEDADPESPAMLGTFASLMRDTMASVAAGATAPKSFT